MTRAERERLIERYLRGQMSHAEEQDFFIEVAADRELRVDLKAYRIVDEALLKDKSAETATYSALRANTLRMMESRKAIAPGAPAVQSPRIDPAGSVGSVPAPPASAGSVGRWTALGGLLLALAVGAFFLLRQDHPVDRPAPVPARVAAPSAPASLPAASRPSLDTVASPPVDSALRAAQPASTPVRQLGVRSRREGADREARSRTADRNDSVRSLRGGMQAAKSDSLKIQLIIQDPKKK